MPCALNHRPGTHTSGSEPTGALPRQISGASCPQGSRYWEDGRGGLSFWVASTLLMSHQAAATYCRPARSTLLPGEAAPFSPDSLGHSLNPRRAPQPSCAFCLLPGLGSWALTSSLGGSLNLSPYDVFSDFFPPAWAPSLEGELRTSHTGGRGR